MAGSATVRRRDPDRRRRILEAAADLVAARGYHEVGMTDIGAAAGISGPAIYRHFDGKSAVLVTMFDAVIDELLAGASAIAASGLAAADAVRALVAGQLTFVLRDRTLAQVYYYEIANLPDEDRHRLRRKQRQYLDEWVRQLAAVLPGEPEPELRGRVHAAVGAIQSVLQYRSMLPPARLTELIGGCAEQILLDRS
jgi:AcrR family transcriptional regulator